MGYKESDIYWIESDLSIWPSTPRSYVRIKKIKRIFNLPYNDIIITSTPVGQNTFYQNNPKIIESSEDFTKTFGKLT